MEARKLRLVQPVRIGAHYDWAPALSWAREPNLRPVITTRGMSQRRYDDTVRWMWTHTVAFMCGVVAVVALVRWA